jgi:nucleotide-binding universal stress UspA family protein
MLTVLRSSNEMPSGITQSGIVVGVDGSEPSKVAVRWAAREATMRNLPLTLVTAIPQPIFGSVALDPQAVRLLLDVQQCLKYQDDNARQTIDEAMKVVEDIAQDVGRPEINSEVFYSAPVPTLVDLSKDAQMVVVGSRGVSALRRGLFGSVSTGLVHHAHCPVAVIHDELLSRLRLNRLPVVVGVDGSPASELATAIAFDEASRRGVELVALHAWCDTDMSGIPSTEWSACQSTAQETLAERLAGWEERYPSVRVRRLVVWDRPARHLLEESESAQVVIVGSHGRGGYARMLLGSVSTAVVHAARTPVIVARANTNGLANEASA